MIATSHKQNLINPITPAETPIGINKAPIAIAAAEPIIGKSATANIIMRIHQKNVGIELMASFILALNPLSIWICLFTILSPNLTLFHVIINEPVDTPKKNQKNNHFKNYKVHHVYPFLENWISSF